MIIEQSKYKFKGSYRGRTPSGIILHAISKYILWEGVWIRCDEFLNKIGLGYHKIILSDSTVLECQQEDKTANHAGVADHNGQRNINTNYLGYTFAVEGENNYSEFIDKINNTDWCNDGQFNTGLEITRKAIKDYQIDTKNIVRHSDVSGDDIRGKGKGKQDTGDGFDYVRFMGSL
jgi:N-acetyl-anhydromuramyl-L-alanine amidase AmpD